MKRTNALLLTTILLCFAGCEDKKSEESNIPMENTTEIFTQKDKTHQKEKRDKKEIRKITINNNSETINNTTVSVASANTFLLSDIKQNRYEITIDNKNISSNDISQPIILINFFATWCPPCKGEIPYLSDLQKKYKKRLFVVGILVNDKQNDNSLKEFISKHTANYFISNSNNNDAFATKLVKQLQLEENFTLPLTILYKEGNYYAHYEGAVPMEMIEHDIQQAMKE